MDPNPQWHTPTDKLYLLGNHRSIQSITLQDLDWNLGLEPEPEPPFIPDLDDLDALEAWLAE